MKRRTTAKKVPFGTMLRAARLCYCYVERLDCFIRFSDHGKNSLVEIRPNDLSQLTSGSKKSHMVPDDPEEIIALSPALSAIKAVTGPVDMLLDDSGELVK